MATIIDQMTQTFVTNSKYLSVCADICNSVKHLKLNKPQRSVIRPEFTRKTASIHLGGSLGLGDAQESKGPETTLRISFIVDTNFGEMDAFQLATECLQEWKKFIAARIN